MASNLYTVITRDQAIEQFEEYILPAIEKKEQENGFRGHKDLPMRREEWNNYTDALCRNDEISDWQYENLSLIHI